MNTWQQALKSAEAHARVTGSVSATYSEEDSTGVLVTATWYRSTGLTDLEDGDLLNLYYDGEYLERDREDRLYQEMESRSLRPWDQPGTEPTYDPRY